MAFDPETPAHIIEDAARLALLEALVSQGYHFITPTPETHRLVIRKRRPRQARDLRDVLGWSLPFARDVLDAAVFELMRQGGLITGRGRRLKSTVRVSSLHDGLFLHSAFPTDDEDAVFFGPDSYRFADFLRAELSGQAPVGRLVEIGAGSGVGAIVAAQTCGADDIVLTDVNPQALRLAAVNAGFARLSVATMRTSGLDGVEPGLDLIVANPPYIADRHGSLYQHGGDLHGAQQALDWAEAAAERLAAGGRFMLYTGAPIVGGEDIVRTRLEALAERTGMTLRYRELDPDVFGAELSRPAYAEVERIAAVGAVLTRPG